MEISSEMSWWGAPQRRLVWKDPRTERLSTGRPSIWILKIPAGPIFALLSESGPPAISMLRLTMNSLTHGSAPKALNPTALIAHIQGFFFGLEEYDSSKTPVLFVHGISGTPRDWKFMVDGLDRTARFLLSLRTAADTGKCCASIENLGAFQKKQGS
jgi:hypothetical protein